jgi:polypeptide N-acetylgalactosaminyltransferase
MRKQKLNLICLFSDELKTGLDSQVFSLPVPVRIVRLSNREGLIRARLAGARSASADVLIFLDAHTEVRPNIQDINRFLVT